MGTGGELYFLEAFAEDTEVTAYRRKLARALAWEPDAAILLQQIVHYWTREWRGHPPRAPFYKFKEVATRHPRYRPGQSWAEELVFTRRRFEGALAQIGTKISRGVSKAAVFEQVTAEFKMEWVPAANSDIEVMTNRVSLVAYWTDGERLTWYELNERLFESLCRRLYMSKVQNDFSPEPKDQNELYHETYESDVTHETSETDSSRVKGESRFTCTKNPNHESDPAETTHTQTGVCVDDGQRQPIGRRELLAYANDPVAGKGIAVVEAWVSKRLEDHKADAAVYDWMSRRSPISPRQCPDCGGSGKRLVAPGDPSQGEEPCGHKRLIDDRGPSYGETAASVA